MSFWNITTFFNPAGYKSPVDNYYTFAKNIPNLITLEVAFSDDPFYLKDSIKIRSNSPMWLKERLINYGISILPKDCDYFSWLDADVLLSDDWQSLAVDKLKKVDVIQLFRRVYYLPKNHKKYQGEHILWFQGIVAQSKTPNWLERRIDRDMKFAAPGFAWAARKDAFINGIYDKDIVGSGDCILVDHLLNSWDLHGFDLKFNNLMKKDIKSWCEVNKGLKIDYLPIDIFHLWHGSLRNRHYMKRHEIIADFDPNKDIKLSGSVYEWNSNKPEMHEKMKQYFYARKEDSDE